MSFTIANWACISASLNQGQETVTPYGGSSTVLNAPNIFMYGSPNDTAATIVAANYFLTQYASLSVGDWIMGFGTDTSFAVQVTAVSDTSVTVASTGITTSIGTANIVNNAVTFAKMQEIATVTLLGNPTGGTTEVSEVTLGSGLEFSSTTLRVPQTYLRYTTVAITAAQFNGMYASPKLLVAAGGANTLLVLEQLQLAMTYVSANYAAGGVAAVQYDSTANGAGVIASTTLSAATFQAAASTTFTMNAGVVALPFTTTVNKGLYLSNITGAFTTGDSTFVAHVWYRVIPTV
jgi:hypothetical protein